LVGERLRCVQAVDSFNVVHSTFIDAVFVRQTPADQDRCANQIAVRKKQEAPANAGAPVLFVVFCCCYCSLLSGGLRRGIHRRLVRAHVTEQNGAVRQIFLHQAGAGRGNRASGDRVHRGHIPAPVQVHMAVAVVAVVVVMTMVPEAAVDVPVTVVMMTVPVVVMMAMTVAVAGGMTDHLAMTAIATALVTAAAATVTAVRTCIGSGRDERRKADNGRGDESEECRTFEHGERPFGSM
jgi:hypothetical protein